MWSQAPGYETSHTARNIAIAVVIIALVVVAAAAVTGGVFFSTPPNRNTAVTSRTSVYHTTQVVELIVNDLIRVEAGSYKHYQFSTRGSATNTISGSYNARGENGNDIQVLIMDLTDFVSFQNNQRYRTYYNNGFRSTGNFNVALFPGETDVLVFSNNFSPSSAMDVQIWASLFYYQ